MLSLRAGLAPALAAACLGLAGPAAAQEPGESRLVRIPADRFAIAPGGVDMRTGRFVYSATDLAIGGEAGGLALTRTLAADVAGHANPFANFSHNWDVMLTEARVRIDNPDLPGNDFRMGVHFGGRSQTFLGRSYGGLDQKSGGPLASLAADGDPAGASVVYTYTAADGTVATFRPLGQGDCSSGGALRCTFVDRIVEPDGTRLTFDYAATGTGGGNARLKRVTSSRGYALILEGSGALVAKACVVNLALAPAGDSCPAGAPATL